MFPKAADCYPQTRDKREETTTELLKTTHKLRADVENEKKTQNNALEEANEKYLVLHVEKTTNKGSNEEPNVSKTASVEKLKQELEYDKLTNKTRELVTDQHKQELKNLETAKTVTELKIKEKSNTLAGNNDQRKQDPWDKTGVRTLPPYNCTANNLRRESEAGAAGKSTANSVLRFAQS